MNNNDLMNALSGLDPKYIDEAAFELHDRPAQIKKTKASRIRKVVFVTLPAAAAILLTFSVALSVVTRMNKSESASMPTADSAVYEAAGEAAAETAPEYDTAETADAAASYDTEEAAEEYEPAAAADIYDNALSAAAESDLAADETAAVEGDLAAEKAAAPETALGLERADFSNSILIVEISGTLPADTKDMEYSVTGTDDNGSEITYSEGKLKDILTDIEPLTLDITDLKLPKGTYTLTVGEESVEFTV